MVVKRVCQGLSAGYRHGQMVTRDVPGTVSTYLPLTSCPEGTNPEIRIKSPKFSTELQAPTHTGILTSPNRRSSAPVRLNRPHLPPIGFHDEYGYYERFR